MISIPHSLGAVPVAPLVAFAVSLAGALACRRARAAWLPAVTAASVLAGWAVLVPGGGWARVASAPRLGPEVLVGVAAACVLAAGYAAWRGGRMSRWLAVGLAGLAGWWLARAGAGAGDFWRVLFGVAGLTWVVSRVVCGQAAGGLACALALWGGLALAGSTMVGPALVGPALVGPALVAAGAWAGLVLVPGAGLPAAAMAGLIGAAELGGGRLLRGRVDVVDVVCVLALAAPVVARMIEGRLGKRLGRFGGAVAACAGAAVVVGVDWVVRRALFT